MWAKYANEFGMDHFLDWRLWSMSAHCANVCPERLEDDQSVELKEWSELPFAEICKFDRMQTAGLDRSAYLREALRRPQSAAQVRWERGHRITSADHSIFGCSDPLIPLIHSSDHQDLSSGILNHHRLMILFSSFFDYPPILNIPLITRIFVPILCSFFVFFLISIRSVDPILLIRSHLLRYSTD